MSGPEGSPSPTVPWQPLTFGGVASFARERWTRLLIVELIVAALISFSVVWFLDRSYYPVIAQAIQKMPETARVMNGQLQGVGELTTDSKFLAIDVTPQTGEEVGQGADLEIQLRRTDFCAVSLFRPDWGMDFAYGKGTSLNLSRSNLEPWWGAWRPMFLAGAGVGVVVILMAAWAALAAVYAFPAKFAAWIVDRKLSWRGAWKLTSASLMPGAVIMIMAHWLYTLQAVDLMGLAFLEVAHLIIGWVYVAGALRATARLFPQPKKGNPFAPT